MLNNSRQYSKTNVALEFIAPQRDNYGKELALLFQGVIDYVKANPQSSGKAMVEKCPEIVGIEKSIHRRFNLKIKINLSRVTLLAVMPMIANSHHILLDESLHGWAIPKDQKDLLAKWDGQSGWVDLQTAKVGGVFSEYTHNVYMSAHALIRDLQLTADEMAATFLHEIGHVFQMYEYSASLETSNQILAELVREIKNGDQKKIEIVYKNYLDLTGSQEDRDLFTSGKTRVVIGATLLKKQFDMVKSQLPNATYNKTSSEAGADIFAVRMGYGRHLVTGLDKIETKYGLGNPDAVRTVNTIVSIMQGLQATYYLIGSLAAGPIGIIIFLAAMWVILNYTAGTGSRDFTYDELRVRYLRMRDQVVALLKSHDYSKKDTTDLLDQIYQLDAIVVKCKDYRPFFDVIADWALPRHRNTKSDIELQRLLEALSHNDLFIKAAEFKYH